MLHQDSAQGCINWCRDQDLETAEPRGKNQLEQLKKHKTETGEMKINGKKYQKFQIFSQRNTHMASVKPVTNNCNHSELFKEISPGEVPN